MAYPGGLPFDPSTVPSYRDVVGAQEPERSAFRAGLARIGAELSNNIPLAIEKSLGTLTPAKEADYQAGLRRGLARSEQLLPGGPMSIDKVGSLGDVGTLIKENLLYSAPQMAASIGGALVARRAPFVGATAAGTPFFVGSNISRATEEGTRPLTGDALMRSVAVAPAQAFADTAAERFLPFARGIFGKGAATQTGNFLARTAKSIGKAGVTEAITETGQQAGERFAAGLALTDRDAAREYVQSFGTAFFVGGAMGSLGGFRKPATTVSSSNASNEELTQAIDQQLDPAPAREPVQMDLNLAPPVTAFPAGYQPDLFGNTYDDLNAVNASSTGTNATSAAEAVEPTLSGVSGGAASNSGAPASTPDWQTERENTLKGISTRKAYLDAQTPEELDTILRARLEGGSTAKGDFELAKRRGIDLNEPAAPLETASTLTTDQAQQTPVDTLTETTTEPAAPANLGGGDPFADAEFKKEWKALTRGSKDEVVKTLKKVNPKTRAEGLRAVYDALASNGPQNNYEGTGIEELAQKMGILDEESRLTPLAVSIAEKDPVDAQEVDKAARAQGFTAAGSKELFNLGVQSHFDGNPLSKFNSFEEFNAYESGRQWIAERNSVPAGVLKKYNPTSIGDITDEQVDAINATRIERTKISDTQRRQQIANTLIDSAQLPMGAAEDKAALKQMAREGDVDGAMAALQRLQAGEQLYREPDRRPSDYKGEVVTRSLLTTRRAQVRDETAQAEAQRQLGKKARLSQDAEAIDRFRQARAAQAERKALLREEINAAAASEDITRREQIALIHRLVTNDLDGVVANLPGGDQFRQHQVKASRREFLAGVAAAAATVSATPSTAALRFTPVTKSLGALLDAGGQAPAVLEHIKKNSPDAGYRMIAAKLLRGDWSGVTILNHGFNSDVVRGLTTLNDDGSTTVEFYGEDGRNEQTILHELIHAYVQQRWAGLSTYIPHNKRLAKDTTDRADAVVERFQDLWTQIGNALKRTNPGLVDDETWANAAYSDPDELLSWVLTNPEAQAYLKSVDSKGEKLPVRKPKSQQSLWDKIVEFFAELFGYRSGKVVSALDEVLSAGYALLDAGASVQPGDFNKKIARQIAIQNGRMPMLKGPPKTAPEFNERLHEVASSIGDAWDNTIGSKDVSARGLKLMAGAMPLTHIAKQYGDKFRGLQQLFDAHADRRATTAAFAHLYDIPKNMMDQLSRSKEGKTAIRLTNEIMELTAWDIDPTKSWEDHKHLTDLDNAQRLRELWAEGNRKYNLLTRDKQNALYDTYRQLNELDRFAGMALAIRQLIVGDPTLQAAMPFFDNDPVARFRNDTSLHTPVAAQRYWRDVLNESVTQATDYLTDLRGTLEEKQHSRLSPLETYLKEVKRGIASMEQAPYFHLGRHGDQFISGRVRLGADKKVDGDAMEHVARELEKLGVTNARISRDLSQPNIYLRVENISQRDQIADLFLRLQDQGWLDKDVMIRRGERNLEEWLPERLKSEVDKFLTNVKAQFEITDEMSDKEKEAMAALSKRAQAVIHSTWLDMLPDSAMSKVLTHRESKPGFDKDMVRNFAFRYNIGVNSLASMAAQPYIDEAFKQMRGALKEAQDARSGQDVDTLTTLFGEVAKREENLARMAGDDRFDKWRAMTHAYFLGLSPSYALVNMTQVPVMLWPELSKKHGFGKAFSAIAKATPLAFRIMRETFAQGRKTGGLLRAADTMITPSVLKAAVGDNPELMKFLQHMVGSGIIDIGSSARELGLVAEGRTDETTQKVLRYAASAGLYSETLTRLIAALAARDLHKGDFDSTVAYAKDTVRESMFEYSTYATPRLMGKMGLFGAFTPVMTQFMQYSTQLTFKLYRELYNIMSEGADAKTKQEARNFLFSHLTAVTALAGTLGMPFATVAALALEKLVDAIDDDDEPYDATAAWRNFMADIFGDDLGEMVSRGVPRAFGEGFDISQRVGEQNLMPFSQLLTDRRKYKDAAAEAALRSLGAPVSMGLSVAGGFGKMANGDVLGGMIDALPSALKGPSKAYQMYADGYKDTLGNKLPMSPGAAAYLTQILGLNPAEKAEYSEVRGDTRARELSLNSRATVLRNRMVNAIMDGDTETMKDALADIQQFNKTTSGAEITEQEIANSIRRRQKLQAISEVTRTPIGVDPKDRHARDLVRYGNIEYRAQ